MNKKIFLLIFIFFVFNIYSQLPENIQYNRTFDRRVRYEATLLEYNSRLYVDAKGGIEEYQILSDGSLELISYISTLHYSIANAIILGDSLFVATSSGYNTNHKIYVIDVSSSPMQLVYIMDAGNIYGISRLSGNADYLFCTPSSSSLSMVYDKNSLQYISELLTGGYYSIHQNYLFYQTTINDSTYLNISDIQDLSNVTEISSLYLGLNQQNIGYFFYGDTLFITQNEQVAFVNISDLYDPSTIAIIDQIPSIPSVNFFTTLIIYENFLMFGNTETKFWIYDISEISFPQLILMNNQFIGGSSYKKTLLLYENNIYYTRTDRNICLMSARELPILNVIAEFGNYGQLHFYDLAYPYLLYSDPFQLKQFCINLNYPNPEPYCLAESPNGWVSPICYNDSLICFITADHGSNNLVICEYDEYDIQVVNSTSLGTTNFSDVFFRGEHLILCGLFPGEVSINVINQDFTISEIGNFTVGDRSFIIDQTSQCASDYLFIRSKYNNEYIIEVFENQVPFNQVSSFELICNNHEFDIFFFLEDDKVLLCDYFAPGGLYYLCNYTFPNSFEMLDSFSSNTITFRLNDNYLFGRRDLSGHAEFYMWQNDEIELVQSHSFDVEFFDVFFLPLESRFIAGGRYNVQEYSCDYVFAINNQISVNKPFLSNHPNPFNPSTTISYNIIESGKVDLSIYNIKGQKVKQLIDEELPAGQHFVIWDGTNDAGKPVASGVYYYQLKAGSQMLQNKALLLK